YQRSHPFMLATAGIESFVAAAQPRGADPTPNLGRCAAALRKAFGTSFTLWDGQSGELLHVSVQQPGSNDLFRGQLSRAIHGTDPQFIADEDCALLLAVPLELSQGRLVVATATFIVRSVDPGEYLNGAASLLGLDQARAMAWISRQPVWPADALLRLATVVQAQIK